MPKYNEPYDYDKGKRMTGLGKDEYVRPEALFLDMETLHDITPGELRYVLGNILLSTRFEPSTLATPKKRFTQVLPTALNLSAVSTT